MYIAWGRGVVNIYWEEVGKCLVIDNNIVKCCLISAALEGVVQEVGVSIKDMEVVIGSKLEQGIASLFSLLNCTNGVPVSLDGIGTIGKNLGEYGL